MSREKKMLEKMHSKIIFNFNKNQEKESYFILSKKRSDIWHIESHFNDADKWHVIFFSLTIIGKFGWFLTVQKS